MPITATDDVIYVGEREIDRFGGSSRRVNLGEIYAAMTARIAVLSGRPYKPARDGWLWAPVTPPVDVLDAGLRKCGKQGGDTGALELADMWDLADVWMAMVNYLQASAKPVTAFQMAVIAALMQASNNIESTTGLAERTQASRVAVVSACRAMERAGLVVTLRSGKTSGRHRCGRRRIRQEL